MRNRLTITSNRSYAQEVRNRRQGLPVSVSEYAGIKKVRLTQRALDGGYAARFLAVFWLQFFPVSTGNPRCHPPQVTHAVRWLKYAPNYELGIKYWDGEYHDGQDFLS